MPINWSQKWKYYSMQSNHSNHFSNHNFFFYILADDISNLTSHFRLGLGVFVDKPISPYMDSEPER